MQCPGCFADVPDGEDRCPQCGAKIPEGAQSQTYSAPPLSSGDAPRQEESMHPLSTMEAVLRPLRLGQSNNLKSMIVGGLLTLIPLLGVIIAMGYNVEYVRKIIGRDDSWNLPDLTVLSLERLVELGRKGLMFFLASIVYAMVITFVDVMICIPFWGAIILAAGNLKGENDAAGCMTIITALVIPLTVIILISVLFSLVVQMLFIYYAKSDMNFFDAFQVGPAFGLIMSDLGGYLGALVYIFVAGIGVGIIACIISALMAIPLLGWIIVAAANAILTFALGLISTSVFSEFYFKNRKAFGVAEGGEA